MWVECKTAFLHELKSCTTPWNGKWNFDYSAEGCSRPESRMLGCIRDIADKDVPLLNHLTSQDGSYIGVLLMGFDKENDQITAEHLETELRGALNDWKTAHPENGFCWPDSYGARAQLGFRERLWFWYRAVQS